MGFSRQSTRGVCPPPEDLPDPGTEPTSLTSLARAGGFFTTSGTWEAHSTVSQPGSQALLFWSSLNASTCALCLFRLLFGETDCPD